MEVKDLTNFVLTLVLIGLILGIGLVVLGAFSDQAREVKTSNNESTANIGSLFAGTPLNTTITLSNIPVKELIRITNASNYVAILNVDYNISSLSAGTIILWNETAGMFTGEGVANNSIANITYTYYYDGKATVGIDDTTDAIAEIPSTWLSLIVLVVVLSIILGLVIRAFVVKGR